MNEDILRYPTGRFAPQASYSPAELDTAIGRIATLPSMLEAVMRSLTDRTFDLPYREGGWTARQVIHHMADSHMNAYIRFKWTLTEDTPVIKAYDQKLWAETPEINLDPRMSVELLKALHIKWVGLLKTLSQQELQREYIHPETNKKIRLDRMVALYAWHGEHHVGHLKIIAEKQL